MKDIVMWLREIEHLASEMYRRVATKEPILMKILGWAYKAMTYQLHSRTSIYFFSLSQYDENHRFQRR